jgi:hypothetical protein
VQAIVYRYWQRDFTAVLAEAHVRTDPYQCGSVSAQERVDDTVLRSRFWPQFSAHINHTTPPDITWWAKTQVQFVGWVDQTPSSVPPDPNASDTRIIATAELTPRLYPYPTSTTDYAVHWDTNGLGVQSFAQRRGDPDASEYLWVYGGFLVTDWTFSTYSGTKTMTFTSLVSMEVLYGSRSHP